jgi:hypothetical protein
MEGNFLCPPIVKKRNEIIVKSHVAATQNRKKFQVPLELFKVLRNPPMQASEMRRVT